MTCLLGSLIASRATRSTLNGARCSERERNYGRPCALGPSPGPVRNLRDGDDDLLRIAESGGFPGARCRTLHVAPWVRPVFSVVSQPKNSGRCCCVTGCSPGNASSSRRAIHLRHGIRGGRQCRCDTHSRPSHREMLVRQWQNDVPRGTLDLQASRAHNASARCCGEGS